MITESAMSTDVDALATTGYWILEENVPARFLDRGDQLVAPSLQDFDFVCPCLGLRVELLDVSSGRRPAREAADDGLWIVSQKTESGCR